MKKPKKKLKATMWAVATKSDNYIWNVYPFKWQAAATKKERLEPRKWKVIKAEVREL